MLSFLDKIKHKKNILKLGGLILVLLLAFNGFKGSFFSVQAFENSLNIFPSQYRIEQNDSAFVWQNVGESFLQDLYPNSPESKFNTQNSAYIAIKPIDKIVATSSKDFLSDKPGDSASSTASSSINSYDNYSSGQEASSSEEYNGENRENKIKNDNSNVSEQGEVLGIIEEGDDKQSDQNLDDENQGSEEGVNSQAKDDSVNEEGLDTSTQDIKDPDSKKDILNPVDTEQQLNNQNSTEIQASEGPKKEEQSPDKKNSEDVSSESREEQGGGTEVEESDDTLSLIKAGFKNIISRFGLNEVFANKKDKKENIKNKDGLQSLIFSDFTVPLNYKNSDIGDIIVNFSLAAASDYKGSKILIDYRTQGDWESLDDIYIHDDSISNSKNGNYFDYNLPNTVQWSDINDLEIRISYYDPEFKAHKGEDVKVFLDAIWLEVSYQEDLNQKSQPIVQEKKSEKKSGEDYIEKIEAKDSFQLDEEPNFKFKYKRENKGLIKKIKSSLLGLFVDEYENIKIKAQIKSPKGELDDSSDVEMKYLGEGEFDIKLQKNKRVFVPGSYEITINVEDQGELYEIKQNFSWGVLALNSNKSIYLPGEMAYLQMAVLDDRGHTLCDADLYLEIKSPDGALMELNTENGLLARNPECGPDNVIDRPDYYTYYSLDGVGDYEITLRAVTANGEREIKDKISVAEDLPFEIERIGPTRIYPKAIYKMQFRVKATEDYSGEFSEFVPKDFQIIDGKEIFVRNSSSTKELSWTVDWKAGETYDFSYAFDAPDRSPEFYLLGPAKVGDFEEARQWQIANDAPSTRVKTVIFEAGNFSGDGTTGQNSDTNQTFSAFNFSLAEKNVSIKNAFIVFESQFESYANLGGAWTGYDLAFDTCSGSACANAFSGSGNVVQTDSNVLTYTESESNQMRILADVTNEVQLAAYTGEGSQMEAQIGYNIKRGTAINAISATKALLYVTYTYDTDSPSITNTVVYPLDSSNGTDRGSRQSSTGSCTLDNNCPLFDYRVEAPEISESLSQWFSLTEQNDGNGSTDIYVDVNIEGTDIDSSTYVHESANGGTQANIPMINFPSVSGYSANTTSSLEYHTYNAGTHYLAGGEVFQTYTASTSASTKTRTVSFPIGALNNGLTTTASSKSVDVYFPENGESSGNISIQKAWFRIIGNDRDSANLALDVVSKVGDNATSSALSYAYNGGGTVIRPAFEVFHIIPESDYSELELANGTSSKTVTLETTSSNANAGVVSAELMITYTYTDETAGYLSSVSLYGGQSSSNGNSQSETLSTANSVLPETEKKKILGASLLSTFALSDSDGNIANANMTFDFNLATSSPSCSNIYSAHPDSVNAYFEIYKDVSSTFLDTDNQSYSTCYTNDGAGDASAGAKVNGIINYTYQYYSPPSLIVTPNNQYRSDGLTTIPNGGWAGDTVELSTFLTNATSSNAIDYYFELAEHNGTFSTTTPVSSCASGLAYNSCSSKVWKDTSGLAPDGWYDENWQYRKKLTINASAVVSNESGFVILATTTDANLAHTDNGGHTGNTQGYDFVVTDSSGTTTIPYEREYYASTTGEIVLWIKTDISTSQNKDLYLYYGNPDVASDMSTTTGVWDSNYEAVWHLNESPADNVAGHFDSTANGITLTPYNFSTGGGSTNASGAFDGADDFDGTDDYLYVANNTIGGVFDAGTTNFTVSAWVRPDTLNTAVTNHGTHNVFLSRGSDSYNDNFELGISTGANLDLYLDENTDDITKTYGGGELTASDWHHVAFSFDNGAVETYLDGVNYSGAFAGSSMDAADGSEFTVGNTTHIETPFDGLVDEIRVSSVVRSANWLANEYANQSDQANFVSFDTEEVIGNLEGRVRITSIPDSLTGYKWQIMACNESLDCSAWKTFDSSPNFIVDGSLPLAPGNLSLSSKTNTSVVLNFGYQGTETNFDTYKIFYKEGSGVSDTDTEHLDSNLAYIDYNGYSSTEITDLEPGTTYAFNIWIYDLAGNKSSATELIVQTNEAPRARSVQFSAGNYSADGTTGQNTDTENTFSSFDIKLGEDEANIKNAYIVYEAQFGAYTSGSDYSGYELAFDTCQAPCTPNAFSGSGAVSQIDNNVLVYRETESNIIRLLFDVTDEVQLAAYSGGSDLLKAQVGYNLKNGATENSIANAQAKLVMTYTFSEDSDSFTNTVIYPLESNGSGDSGSMQTNFVDCTLDSDCPTFDYNMDISEYSVSAAAERVSQWFKTNNVNDATGVNDISVDLNIQGTDILSSPYIREASLNGGQANIENIIFDSVPGFSENTNQSLEYRAISPDVGAYYLVGGEVYETYIASTSATTKTRTIRFPIGILNKGLTASSSLGQVDVYFPENGNSDGNVDIKKAWFKISSNNYASAANTITVDTKVGINATSSSYTYNYNPNGNIVDNTMEIIHIIPSADYSELESANGVSPKTVSVQTQNSNSTQQGGTFAELVITYSYIDETSGYLTNLSWLGGQSAENGNAQVSTSSILNLSFPESGNTKTLLAAGLLTNFTYSDSDGGVNSSRNIIAGLASSSPDCSTIDYYSRADGSNVFTELMVDVSDYLGTNNRDDYEICYANDGGGDVSGGAKMGAELFYTYQYYNPPPITLTPDDQYKSDQLTAIPNNSWTNESEVYLSSYAADTSASTTQIDFYYNLVANGNVFSTASSAPVSSCADGSSYNTCSSKIWKTSDSLAGSALWYDSNWLYRKKITINASQVMANESNFPVLATTTDSALAYSSFGGKVASSSGADIIVTDSDGATLLDFDREYYSSSTGEIVLWIKTDISSTTNKDLYIYYGNVAIDQDYASSTAVWSNNFKAVWNMGQNLDGTSNEVIDSTGNLYDGTSYGGMSSSNFVDSKIGYGYNFNGSSNYVALDMGYTGTNAISEMTACSWFKTSFSSANYNDNWALLDFDRSEFFDLYVNADDGTIGFSSSNNGAAGIDDFDGNTAGLNDGNWHYVCATYDGIDKHIYVDGESDGTKTNPHGGSGLGSAITRYGIIGDGSEADSFNSATNGFYYQGDIDQIEYSEIERDANWIKTRFNNQSDPGNFATFSTQEQTEDSINFTGISHVTSIPDSSVGYKWQVMSCNDIGDCTVWKNFDVAPNFYVDATPPTAPGNLSLSTTTATTIELNFGSQTTDTNFTKYRIFYKEGLSGVDDGDRELTDSDLEYIDYNGTATTTIAGLQSETQYVINIWAYDIAGNKTAASELVVSTAQAPHARSRTVMFPAGFYSGDGTTGQNTDTDYTFSPFNFELGETDVEVRNAYVLFEAQIEAYANNANNYTGYDLSFDSCTEPCTADSFAGSGRIEKNDTSVLAYNESESNQIRLLLDVTDELQLSAYGGNSSQMEAQIGYNIANGLAANSIANARAKLFITYSYNGDDSNTLTNTVIYPLESTGVGDSGTKRLSQANNCTLDSDCPTFAYNMDIPEFGTKLSQWFETYMSNDVSSDVTVNVNIQGADVNSDTFIHEEALGGEQSSLPRMIFKDVYGFTENFNQELEYSQQGSTAYLMGGEVFETYTYDSSETTKTRTVNYPIGVITNGQDTNTASSSVFVYFPENGSGSGIVSVKKAWFRVKINDSNSSLYNVTLSSKAGDNSVSSDYIYSIDAGGAVVKPSTDIIHIIPDSDYSELELANASNPKEIVLNVTNGNVVLGGVSAELMVTYQYTDESSGYLSSINIFGGQSTQDANAQSDNQFSGELTFSELRGAETVRSAGLKVSNLLTDSDSGVPGGFASFDVVASTSISTATPAFYARPDGINSFVEYYKNIFGSIDSTDRQKYVINFANDGAGDTSAGAKMNSQLIYTYQWDAPPTELTQNDWRWYENIDDTDPTTPLVAAKTSITNIDIGQAIRLRINVGVSKEDMAAGTQSFKLQYGIGTDCSLLSSWTDVDSVGGSGAWTGYNNPAPIDGANISSTLLSSSTVTQTYEESNPSKNNPNLVPKNEYAEWDWTLYNNSATSSSDYCFRMIKADGHLFNDYLSDSYPKLKTNKANTKPDNASNLAQYKSDEITEIPNLGWIDQSEVRLVSSVTDPNLNEIPTLYFELIDSASSFTTATSEPSGACVYGTAYASCASNIWFVAPASPGDYRTVPYTGTTSITSIPESSSGYKWQVLACDDDGECSSWQALGGNPNFRIDLADPTPPGALSFSQINATSIEFNFGASTTEDNFDTYKIFYKVGSSGVSINDLEFSDANMAFIDYNGVATTSIDSLSAGTEYVFNIWAYDLVGHTASSVTEISTTTASSFTPPTGGIYSTTQKTDGSGIIDMVFFADDPDNDDTLRIKMDYVEGATCDFSSALDPSLDESDENTTAVYGDPKIDNNSTYQIGSSTGWILTSPGENYISLDWMSQLDVPTANGTYCVRTTVNDGLFDQSTPDTQLLVIDNVAPTTPGALSLSKKDYDSVVLAFGSASVDSRFDKYRIYYREGTDTVSENDTEYLDSNLSYSNYHGATSTEVTGLSPNTSYTFNIWAYDTLGNKASSSQITIKTNAIPSNITALNQYKSDGTTVIPNGSWTDDNGVVLSASAHDQDASDLLTFYYELLTQSNPFNTGSEVPSAFCLSGASYASCSSKIWAISTTTSVLPSDWYDRDWLYRKELTINSSKILIDDNNFVALINTTDSDLANKARSDAYDVLFTDSSGTSTLLFEREYYDSSTGELSAWVKTPVSSSTDTTIYMYYGNAGASVDLATTTNIWDSNYVSIWHLSENVVDESSESSVHRDSVGSNNGDQYGNNEMPAIISRGQEFDGNDHIDISDDNSLDLSDALTLSSWINVSGSSDWKYSRMISLSPSTPEDNYQIEVILNSSNFDYTKADSNGDDLRFYDESENELDYYIDNWNISGTSTVWVEVANTGTSFITMKYGNASATAMSNAANTFVFFDNFEDGDISDWSTYGNGVLSAYSGGVDSSSYSIEKNTDTDPNGGYIAYTPSINDFELIFDTNKHATGAGAQTRLGLEDSSYNGYSVQLTDPAGGAGNLCIETRAAGTGGNCDVASVGVSTAMNTWYEMRLRRYGTNNLEVDFRDQYGFTILQSSSGTDSSYSSGFDRMVIHGGEPFLVDDIRLRRYSANDPSVTVGSEMSVGINKTGAYSLTADTSTTTVTINNSSLSASISSGWNYITLSYDRTASVPQQKLYVNGQLEATSTYSTSINTNSADLILGNSMNGYIDEVRISDSARDENYIKTLYNNENDPSSFVSFASESRVTSYFETSLILNIPDDSSGYKWQVKACDDDGDCSAWASFGTSTPNFLVDTTAPTAPGSLSSNDKTSTSIILSYGAQTTETNFSQYRIFYSTTTPVYETDTEIDNTDLDYIDYNGSSITSLSGLTPNTDYYFNIWAYDKVGHKASSTVSMISTNPAVSSPGAIFYTKNDRTLYYKVWDGSNWGSEQIGPTFGSAAGDNIRHIRTERSDDGGKISILVKTWDGTNQEWWASIYRFVANDFVNTTQLGASLGSATNAQIMTACMAPISGGEFFIVKSNGLADGTQIYTWDITNGWAYDNAGPNPVARMNGCTLVRRPGTDNYLLVTFDDDSDVGTAYYYGGANYTDTWTSWTQHSGVEEDTDNFAPDAFFDPSDNTRGAISYSDSNSAWFGKAKFFVCDANSINYGSSGDMPTAWTDDFVHGEFASDPGGTGVAYYAGRDIDNRLSVLKLDISSDNISWSTTTNGTDIASTNLYQQANDSQKPFDITFYRSGEGVVSWNSRVVDTPYYRYFNTSSDTLDSSNTSVPGAPSDLWTRARTYNDPNEEEFITIYQNDNVDYAAVFFDGASDKFYNTIDNPASNQVWTTILAGSGAFDRDDEAASFSYASYNSPPNTPSVLTQYKTDASTTVANLGWTNESTILLETKVNDPDTDEVIRVFLELLTPAGTFTSTTTAPANACSPSTDYMSCASKIWAVATSTAGDYSLDPFVATATISSIPDSATGYKWQVIACDDEPECSSWKVFDATSPNFKVDTIPPTIPGALSISSKDSQSIDLSYGSASTENNFSEYKIYYKIAASGVAETDTEHDDTDLDYINYNSSPGTSVSGLASSTQYVFNIWAYDLAGNSASSTEVSTTTSAGPNIEQTSYLIENDNGTSVNLNSTETSVDTSLTNVEIGERMNARIQVENNGGDILSNTVYKLQFENQTDNPGTWVDLGASTEISYSLGLSGSNGDSITSAKAALNSNTWNFGTWQEGTGQTASYSLDYGKYTEFVFAIETSNALIDKTYRLRLYNESDSKELNLYSSYPTISTVVSDTIRYSKDSSSSLSSGINDLTYYLDKKGYNDVSLNDDVDSDPISSVSAYPVFNFATKHTNNTDAITVIWDGQSNISPSNKTVYLQVYKYGSPNQWVTVATNNTTATSTDLTFNVNLNSSLSSYYDTSNWTYWRVYQESGTEKLDTDYFNISFSAPVTDAKQIHYRWRNDDGSQSGASWRESEDLGDPTGATVELNKGENIRLRLEVTNVGGGSASNYNYQIEYAPTLGNCSTDPGGWTAVTTDESGHWNMSTSTNVSDGDTTTAQLFNNESYSFVAGDVVTYSSQASGNISLTENDYTELEYVIRATNNANTAGTYCFRVTNSGSALDAYDILPVLTLAGNTNNAPYFTTEASDNGSASTSPTNYGNTVSFTATAQDDDVGDDYYLAVCKTAAVTAGNDAPPTCTAGDWCISNLASSTVEASCEYTASDSSEELEWYAYACDKHTGFSIAKCSLVSQGSGGSNASPFVINHPPVLTSASTANNNQDPGSTFNISTVSSDGDISGGADTLDMYICRGTTAAYGVGCAGGASDTICSVIATSSSNISCSYNDVAPTPAGDNDYNVFLFDEHGLAADNNYITSSYTVNNTPPILGSLVLNGNSDITLNLAGAPDVQIQTINTSVVDQNGCDTGLVSASAVIYMSGASGAYNCSDNENDCYQINISNCLKSDCIDDNDSVATYTCTASMKYFATPTDDSTGNPWATEDWLSYINIYDGSNYVSTSSNAVELITNIALDVPENVIDFGSNLFVGQNTGSDNSTTTIVNIGNSPIDTAISGTDMAGNPSGTIGVNNIEWDVNGFTWSNGTDLSSSDVDVNINAPNPISSAGTSDNLYWGIGVPYGADASIYYGLNNFSVKLDNNDWQTY